MKSKTLRLKGVRRNGNSWSYVRQHRRKKAETPPQRVTKWIHYTKLKDNAAQYCNERDKDEIIALAGLIDADNGVLQQILVRK